MSRFINQQDYTTYNGGGLKACLASLCVIPLYYFPTLDTTHPEFWDIYKEFLKDHGYYLNLNKSKEIISTIDDMFIIIYKHETYTDTTGLFIPLICDSNFKIIHNPNEYVKVSKIELSNIENIINISQHDMLNLDIKINSKDKVELSKESFNSIISSLDNQINMPLITQQDDEEKSRQSIINSLLRKLKSITNYGD